MRCSIAGVDRPPADVRFPVRSDRPVHVLVGHDRRAVSVPVVLRHRSEPGAAVSDGAIGGRGAGLALDERVLEDSAAVAGAAHRRLHVRVLPVHAAADAVQRVRTTSGAREPAGGRICGAGAAFQRSRSTSGASGASSWRLPSARERSRRPCLDDARFKSWNDEVASIRADAVALVKDVSGDSSYNDVNFVFPTWVTTQLPVGLVGLHPGRDLRRGDVDDLGGAGGAVDGDHHRLLSALDARRGDRPHFLAVSRSRPDSGVCSRRSSPSGRSSSAR